MDINEINNPTNTSRNLDDSNNSKKFIAKIVIIGFVAGIIGGGVFDKILLPYLEKFLGKSGNVVIRDKVENVSIDENSAVIDVAKKVSPSVVTIVSKSNVFDFFGDLNQKKGTGTGFVLTADGLILTNKHVVSDANANYTVIASDGKDYKAKILTTDPSYDLAIIKIDAKNLKVVELGDSDELEVGQRVVAIGSALGEFENTVTSGVISAKNRPITAGDGSGSGGDVLEGLLQTDAAINPGNSGGPLLNVRGQVVGINTAVANAENIGFAIPVNIAKPAIDSTLKTGKISRPMIGIRYISITKDIAALNDLPVDKGAWLYTGSSASPAVVPGGPAAKAGLKEGDIITRLGDQEIDKNHGLSSLIQKYSAGEGVELTFLRDGKENKVKVTLSTFSE